LKNKPVKNLNAFGASYVFDETHEYASKNRNVKAFQPIQEVRQIEHPVLLVGISGTLPGKGPAGWQHFLEHTIFTAKQQDWTLQLGDASNPPTIEENITDWDWLLANLGNSDLEE
jgi:hypothetical protein